MLNLSSIQIKWIKLQRGFTLLELVLVLFLVGLLASAGLLFTQNIEDQAQFDETQRRLEIIRKAIIQSGDRTVNGQPELTGFVVDNGRLPYCLAELLGPEFIFTDSASSVNHYQSPCDANSLLLLRKPVTNNEGLRVGWWGPYIQVNPDRDGVRAFRDGYGNDDLTLNYGWLWTLSESATPVSIASFDPDADTPPRPYDLTVQSSGFDLADPADDYPADLTDYLLVENEWLNADAYAIQFVNTSAVSAIDNLDDTLDWTFTLTKSAVGTEEFTSGSFDVTPPSSSLSPGATFQKSVMVNKPVPAGYYLAGVICNDASASPPAECPVMQSQPYTLQVLPRHQLGPIRWNLRPQ